MAVVTICSDFEAQEIKSVIVPPFPPSICHEVMGPDAMMVVLFFFKQFIILFISDCAGSSLLPVSFL